MRSCVLKKEHLQLEMLRRAIEARTWRKMLGHLNTTLRLTKALSVRDFLVRETGFNKVNNGK